MTPTISGYTRAGIARRSRMPVMRMPVETRGLLAPGRLALRVDAFLDKEPARIATR